MYICSSKFFSTFIQKLRTYQLRLKQLKLEVTQILLQIQQLLLLLQHPVTILVTDFTNPNNLTNALLILKSLIINKSLVKRLCKTNFQIPVLFLGLKTLVNLILVVKALLSYPLPYYAACELLEKELFKVRNKIKFAIKLVVPCKASEQEGFKIS